MSFRASAVLMTVALLFVAFSATAAAKSQTTQQKSSSSVPAILDTTSLHTLTTKQLRRLLYEHNSECKDCVERSHLLDKAIDVLHSQQNQYTTDLTAVQHSIKQQMFEHHVQTPPALKDEKIVLPKISFDPRVECHSPFDNETVYCGYQATSF
eukprot:PhF_6_TR4793/c0_g1_i2/m.6611